MEKILIGIAIGVGSTLVVGLLLRLAHVFDAGKNIRQMWTEIRRALRDYELWSTRRDRRLHDELIAIDNDLSERGVYNSSLRPAAHTKAREEASLDNKEAMTKRARAIDDAFNKMRKVDLVWLALTMDSLGWRGRAKGAWTALTKPPLHMERMLEEVMEKAEGEGKFAGSLWA